jgi:hypothetical protein
MMSVAFQLIILCRYTKCHFAECRGVQIFTLLVVRVGEVELDVVVVERNVRRLVVVAVFDGTRRFYRGRSLLQVEYSKHFIFFITYK